MADPRILALIREYWQRGALTRTEVGRFLGYSRGKIAGICRKAAIKHWPVVGPLAKRARRGCHYPVGAPGTKSFRLCGRPLAPGHTYLCEHHRTSLESGAVWTPPED